MLYADTFVNKNYLINLDRYPLVELDSAEKSDEYIRLYQIARDAVCRNFLEEYGAGNFVRTAEAKFKTVRYFTCSALGHNHEGQPYEGKNVVDPVMWLLQQADSSIKAE